MITQSTVIGCVCKAQHQTGSRAWDTAEYWKLLNFTKAVFGSALKLTPATCLCLFTLRRLLYAVSTFLIKFNSQMKVTGLNPLLVFYKSKLCNSDAVHFSITSVWKVFTLLALCEAPGVISEQWCCWLFPCQDWARLLSSPLCCVGKSLTLSLLPLGLWPLQVQLLWRSCALARGQITQESVLLSHRRKEMASVKD